MIHFQPASNLGRAKEFHLVCACCARVGPARWRLLWIQGPGRRPASQGAAVQRPYDRCSRPQGTAISASKEGVVADEIARLLDSPDIAAGSSDLAICGGACGGDLLFAEACLARGTALEMYIGFDENTFLADSVDFANANWRGRYFNAKSKGTLHIAPDELGPLPSAPIPTSAITGGCWSAPRAPHKYDFHLPVEWRGRRRSRRHEAFDGRSPQELCTRALAQYSQALRFLRQSICPPNRCVS